MSHQAKPSIANASSLFAEDEDPTQDTQQDPFSQIQNQVQDPFHQVHPTEATAAQSTSQPEQPAAANLSIDSQSQLQPPGPASAEIPSPTALFGDTTNGNDDWLGGGGESGAVAGQEQQVGSEAPVEPNHHYHQDPAAAWPEHQQEGQQQWDYSQQPGYDYSLAGGVQQPVGEGGQAEGGFAAGYDEQGGYYDSEGTYHQGGVGYNQQASYDPNAQYDYSQQAAYDPNQYDYSQQQQAGCDPNQATQWDPNSQYDPNQHYDPNQFDQNQVQGQEGAQYDPNQYDQQQQNYDPNQYQQHQGYYAPSQPQPQYNYDQEYNQYSTEPQTEAQYDPYAPQTTSEVAQPQDSGIYDYSPEPIQSQEGGVDPYAPQATPSSLITELAPPPRGPSPYDPISNSSVPTISDPMPPQPATPLLNGASITFSATPPPPKGAARGPPRGPPSKKTSLGVYEVPKPASTPTPASSSTFQAPPALEVSSEEQFGGESIPIVTSAGEPDSLSWGNEGDGGENAGWVGDLEDKADAEEEQNQGRDEFDPESLDHPSTAQQGLEQQQIDPEAPSVPDVEGKEVANEVSAHQESDDHNPTPAEAQTTDLSSTAGEDLTEEVANRGMEALSLEEDTNAESQDQGAGLLDEAEIIKAPSPFSQSEGETQAEPSARTSSANDSEGLPVEANAQEVDPEAGGEYGAYSNGGGYNYDYDYQNQAGDQQAAGEYQAEGGEYGAYQDEGGYGAYGEEGAYGNEAGHGAEGYGASTQDHYDAAPVSGEQDPYVAEANPSSDPYSASGTSTYDPYAPASHSISSSSTDTEHPGDQGQTPVADQGASIYNPYAPQQQNQYGAYDQPAASNEQGGDYNSGHGYDEMNHSGYENSTEVYDPYAAPQQNGNQEPGRPSQLNVVPPHHELPQAPSVPSNQQSSAQFSSPYDPSPRQPPHSAHEFGSNHSQNNLGRHGTVTQRNYSLSNNEDGFLPSRVLNVPSGSGPGSSHSYGNLPKSAPAYGQGTGDYGFPLSTPGTANGSDFGGYFANEQSQGPPSFGRGGPPSAAVTSPYAPSSNYGPRSDYGAPNSLPSHSRTTSAIGGIDGYHDPLEEKRSTRIPVISFGVDGKILTYFPSFDSFINGGGDSEMGAYSSGGLMSSSRSSFPTQVSIRPLKNVIPSSSYASVFEPNSYPGPLFEGSSTTASSAFSKATGSGANNLPTAVKNKKMSLIKYLEEKAEDMKRGVGYLRRRGSTSVTNALTSTEMVNQNSASSASEEESERRAAKEEDKILLLRLLAIILTHDGNTVNNPKFDSAVRDLLIESSDSIASSSNTFVSPFGSTSDQKSGEVLQTYELKSDFLNQIQSMLLKGERREAVQFAIEKKMWAHAMTIASSVDKDSWRDVVKQFSDFEILQAATSSGAVSAERLGLKVAYDLISGQEPSEAYSLFRPKPTAPSAPGLPSASTLSTHALLSSGDASASSTSSGQPKWKQSAAVVVANRSAGDSASLTAIGDGLIAGDWHEAAHICYLLSPLTAPFGGIDTPTVRFTLLGAKSPRASSSYLTDLDSLALTEIYEFAHCLTPVAKGQEPFNGIPHLQAYRLAHAYLLAEMGDTQKAQKYCEAIAATLKSGKPSPYFHRILVSQLKELSERLTGAPHHSEGSSSWMARKMQRPTLDGMWGALEGRFTKFIAGEDPEGINGPKTAVPNKKPSSNGKSDAIGPFSHYSSITPDATSGGVSRVQSFADFNGGGAHSQQFGSYSGMSTPPLPSSRAGSAMDFHQTTRTSSPANRATSAMGIRQPLRDPFSEWPQSNQNQQANSSPGVTPTAWGQQSSQFQQVNSEKSSESGGGYEGPYSSQGPTRNAPWYNNQDQAGGSGAGDPSSQWGSSYEASANGRTSQDSQGRSPTTGVPYYGYQSHGAEQNQFATNVEADGQVGDNFVSPMDAFSATTPQPDYGNSYSNQNNNGNARRQEEEEEEDDLGFGNSSNKKKANPDTNAASGPDSQSNANPPKADAPPANQEEKKPELKSSASGGSWLGRFWGKKDPSSLEDTKAKKAHLGEETSFYYDKETKRWVNKKAAGDASPTASPTPPPPRAQTTSPSMQGRLGAPPPSGARRGSLEGQAPPRGTPPISESGDEEGGGWGSNSFASMGAGAPPPRARSNLAEAGQPAAVQPSMRSASVPGSAGPSSTMGTPPPGAQPPRGGPPPGGKKKPIKNRYVVVD